LCREEALDISQRYEAILARNPSLQKVKLVGVVKEVAPTSQAETDEKLGVGEFQSRYFGNRPIYLDSDRRFYELLGNRKLSISFWSLVRPWKLWNDFKSMQGRLQNKKVDGNLIGEGFVQGGLLVFAPGTGCDTVYRYEEVTGSEVPLDAFEAGFLKLSDTCGKVQ